MALENVVAGCSVAIQVLGNVITGCSRDIVALKSAAAGWSSKEVLLVGIRSGVLAFMSVIPCYTNLELSPVL